MSLRSFAVCSLAALAASLAVHRDVYFRIFGKKPRVLFRYVRTADHDKNIRIAAPHFGRYRKGQPPVPYVAGQPEDVHLPDLVRYAFGCLPLMEEWAELDSFSNPLVLPRKRTEDADRVGNIVLIPVVVVELGELAGKHVRLRRQEFVRQAPILPSRGLRRLCRGSRSAAEPIPSRRSRDEEILEYRDEAFEVRIGLKRR